MSKSPLWSSGRYEWVERHYKAFMVSKKEVDLVGSFVRIPWVCHTLFARYLCLLCGNQKNTQMRDRWVIRRAREDTRRIEELYPSKYCSPLNSHMWKPITGEKVSHPFVYFSSA